MTDENGKTCPFCKEKINEAAIKCRYCQSLLTEVSGSSKTERLAELVIKAVGIIPITMAILLVIAGLYGIKTVSDVQDFAKKAKVSSESIEKQARIYNILVEHHIESRLSALLNDLNVDSNASKANTIRKELRELLEELKKYAPNLEKSSALKLTEGLFAYYEQESDKAVEILTRAEDSSNKFRLLGIVTNQKGYKAEKANNMDEAKILYQKAYNYFNKAEKMIGKEECQLLNKNRANRAAMAANIGQFEEAEAIFRDLLKKDPDQLIHYYNMARLYSQWGKPDRSIEILEQGIQKGIVEAGDLTREHLTEDSGFINLRSSTDPKIKEGYKALLKKLP